MEIIKSWKSTYPCQGGSAFEEDREDVVAGGLYRLHLRQPSGPFPNRPPKPAVAMDGDLQRHWNGRSASSLFVLHLPLWLTRCSGRNAGRPRARWAHGQRDRADATAVPLLRLSACFIPSEYLPHWTSLMFLIPLAADNWQMPLLTGGICPAGTPAKCAGKGVRNASPPPTPQPLIQPGPRPGRSGPPKPGDMTTNLRSYTPSQVHLLCRQGAFATCGHSSG